MVPMHGRHFRLKNVRRNAEEFAQGVTSRLRFTSSWQGTQHLQHAGSGRHQLSPQIVCTVLNARDVCIAIRIGFVPRQEMPVRAEANAGEHRGCTLVRPRGAVAVKHMDYRRPHCVNHHKARPPVIYEEVGNVVCEGQALLVGFIRSTDEDEPVSAVCVQTAH
jgi:hypothetical protein